MDDEKYDKYTDKYTEEQVEFAQEYFAEDDPISSTEAVDAMEDAGVKGVEEDEW